MSYIDTKKKWNRIVACVMAVILSASMTISPLAAEAVPNTPKEEVVYVNLNTDGSVKEINVVNIFDLDKDGQIVDYGRYESLRNMTTTDNTREIRSPWMQRRESFTMRESFPKM